MKVVKEGEVELGVMGNIDENETWIIFSKDLLGESGYLYHGDMGEIGG
jgi:hypothetical protein